MRTHIGQYRIEAPLGRGGMGVVYRGVHEHLGRPVAIKALAPELTQQPEFKERFFSEAKTQARLQHPNIVGVYDLLEEGGEYFIVMEFVAGEGLDDRLKAMAGQRMDVHEAIAIFSQVLAALDYAHSEGVIHRDIKPSNVMITADGRVKLTDFGIALLVGDKRLTASQSAIGTPTYMSPEQILRPRSVDHRTDLYSAAVVFYEMLAGRPPFDDETEYGIKKQHIEALPPDITELHPGLPAGVVLTLSTTLGKNPDERFASAGLFLRALQEAVPQAIAQGAMSLAAPAYRPASLDSTRAGAAAPPVPPPPVAGGGKSALSGRFQGKNRWIALAAAAAVVLLVGFGVVVLLLSSGGEDKVADTAVGTETASPPAAVPSGGSLPAPVSPEMQLQTVPAAGPEETAPSASVPVSASAQAPPQRTVPVQETPRSLPRERTTERTPPQPAGETAPPPAAVEEPAPVPAAAEPAPQPSSAADAGIDQFKEMEDLIVSIERLSEQVFEAYEQEGKEDALYGRLESFSEAAIGVRREFRKVTGTGIRGVGQNMKNIFRRGGQGADIRTLEIKVEDLDRRSNEVDGLISSSGSTTREYWKEIKSNLRKLKKHF